MILLHAAWLAPTSTQAARLALWGEHDPPPAAAPAGQAHPFAAAAPALRAALPRPELAARAELSTLVAHLPTRRKAPLAAHLSGPATGRLTLADWEIPTLLLAPADALAWLINLPPLDDETPGLALSAEVRYWQAAARFALELLAGQKFQPTLESVTAATPERCLARWRPVLEAPEDQARLTALAGAMPPAARAVAWAAGAAELGPRALLTDFLNSVTDGVARAQARLTPRRKHSRLTDGERWLAALSAEGAELELPAEFLAQYRAWAQPAAGEAANFRLCFRLDTPETHFTEEVVLPKAGRQDWSLRYFLQANDDASLLVPAEMVWRGRGEALTFLNRKFDQPQEKLLAGLGLAARVFAPIEDSLRQARPQGSPLDAAGAHAFIREAALLLQASGFGVLLPGLSTRLGLRLKLRSSPARKAPKGGVTSLTFERAVAFDWELALGDQPLTRAEFETLAGLKVPLVQIRGQWVEVRPEQLQQALAFLDQRATAGELDLAEALKLALAPEPAAGLPIVQVEGAGWFGDLLGQLGSPAQLKKLAPPKAFAGTLRHYQVTGFSWLAFLRQFGLGACLADDMGLGKTPQTIAYLLQQRSQRTLKGHKPALVVCPTSVVSNWAHELAHFAPRLRVLVHQGEGRFKDDFVALVAEHDVVITSYALLHRDEPRLKAVDWGEVILDEAQNIKNPDTKQAKAARGLPAEHRLALTGTPIENRLSELWSIFQFLNAGYLGTQADFQARFARPIERLQDPAAAEQLKALVAPFILRRVKTDPSVITDLPAKNEMKVFCNLTREQATLYQAVVADSLRQIDEAEGVQRRGLVLATLLKLKQVCNHPAQFLGDASALAERSGKLNRLAEMLEEVRAVKERVLIFTQFAEMGRLLQDYLQASLSAEALFLHGGTPAKARGAMVERFQNDPHGPAIFLLSIKAGGTGLNLTRANHVFHFDRWWNPAVENQATDRAFRIGQTRQVQVYKFVCAGTVEERIDEMIERKQALAASIVGSSEAWITEMTTGQLRELFALRPDAVA